MSEDGRALLQNIQTDDHKAGSESQLFHDLVRDEEFWFEDGNLVLVAGRGQLAFKIYRGLLAAQSPIFADMFATADPDRSQRYDGCPAVRLSDSPEDLRHLLRALLPKLGPSASLADDDLGWTFNQLSSLTRLGHKYGIDFIERQAVARLKLYFTDTLDKWSKIVNLPFDVGHGQEIDVVHLARLTDNPSMLPTALYSCSVLGGAVAHGWTREDGTVQTLDVYDLERCINGYGFLRDRAPSVLHRIFQPHGDSQCSSPGSCRSSLDQFYEIAKSHPQSYFLLHSDSNWLKNDGIELCSMCIQTLQTRERNEHRNIWQCLPTIYGLATPPGWKA